MHLIIAQWGEHLTVQEVDCLGELFLCLVLCSAGPDGPKQFKEKVT